jgi:hypothetical protein
VAIGAGVDVGMQLAAQRVKVALESRGINVEFVGSPKNAK